MKPQLKKSDHFTSSERSTQRDVAIKAGVSQATVSMALSDHSLVAIETRQRIKRIAEEIGYQPDPYLVGLAAYRKRRSVPSFQATLAWMSNWHEARTSQWGGVNGSYFQGASARAKELGYQLEEHALKTEGMTSARMEQILQARNIQGILLPPQSRPGSQLDFCFDRFSVVTFGYTLAAPQLHTVTLHHYRSIEILFRKLLNLGYKRPGLALRRREDIRTDRIWSAAFWSEQRLLPASRRVPLLLEETLDAARFLKWFQRYKPDVVIGGRPDILQWMTEAGISVPEEAGFATLSASEDNSPLSGIWQNLQITGAKALDLLIDMIHRGERGIPKVRSNLLIDATWVDGRTVRPQS